MQIQDESYIKWKLFLEGNDEAYSWLYTHHIQLLYQYGLQITPDTEVIKDCIQDVFIRIYKNKNKLSIPQNVKIYLMISLKTVSIMFSVKSVQKNPMPSTSTLWKNNI